MKTPLPLVLGVALLLAGCSVRIAEERDGPPAGGAADMDFDSLPEVVPENEPLSRYGNPESYEVFGERYYVMDSADGYVEEGIASWYGRKFHGRRTSSGETYNMYALTAAHRELPLPTYVRVTRLDTGEQLVVKVNDRGPFHDNRIIDLSYAAAVRLGFSEEGTAPVRVEALEGGTPIMTATADAATVPPADDGPSWLQLGAFAEFANAQEMRARAAGANVRPVSVERGRDGSGRRIYRVRVGPIPTIEERREIIERLDSAGIRLGGH